MPKYELTINSDQARIIAMSLEFWSRCRAGQLEELRNINPKNWRDLDHNKIDILLGELKSQIFPELSPTRSSFNYTYGKEAFNIKRVIDKCVAEHEYPLKPGDMPTTSYYGPVEGWWETTSPAVMVPKKE